MRPPTQIIPSGFSDALTLLTNGARPPGTSCSISAIRSAQPGRSATARARLQQRQTIAQSRQLELQIATEVTNAAVLVDSNSERLQAATAPTELAEFASKPSRAGSRSDVRRTSSSCRRSGPARRAERRTASPARLSARTGGVRARAGDPAAGGVGITNIQPGGGTAPRERRWRRRVILAAAVTPLSWVRRACSFRSHEKSVHHCHRCGCTRRLVLLRRRDPQ